MAARPYTNHLVPREGHRIFVRQYAGAEPPIVLMHGFPDSLHLYDRLVPLLRGRRVVLFDFLGWGRSDSPEDHAYTFESLEADLDAVIEHLVLVQPILVAHDASGPPAINWALDHPERVGALVLLNTFYHLTPTLRPPEAIAIFADLLELRTAALGLPSAPWSFQALSRAIADDAQMGRWLYYWQVGGFIRDEAVRRAMLPRLYRQFARRAGRLAFFGLNGDLPGTVLANTSRAPELRSFARPARIIFGGDDPYLNAGVAESLHALLPTSDLFLLPTARHYVQVDEPEEVARLLLPVGVTR